MRNFFTLFARLLLIIALLFLFIASGLAKDGSIRLRVIDTYGMEIPEARVICKDPQEQIVKQAMTDGSGSATISLPEGMYTIHVERPGYLSRTNPVTVKAEWETVLDIRLQKDAPRGQEFGVFPMEIKLGPPSDTNMFTLKISNPLENSEFSTIQFVQQTVSMEQFRNWMQSLNQSVWLQVEANVPYVQMLSVLDILYRYQRTERVYLNPIPSDSLVFPVQPKPLPMTALIVMVDDYFVRHEGPRIADATVEIQGPMSVKQKTASHGGTQFTQIPPGEYIVSVTKEGYQSQSAEVIIQPETVPGLVFHLVKVDTPLPEPSHTRIRLPHDESELKLPAANMRKPTQSYNMLILDRSFVSQKVVSFESGSIVQMITSLEQMQSAFRQATSKQFLIAADETVESQWILGMLKYAAEAGFTDFGFVVR